MSDVLIPTQPVEAEAEPAIRSNPFWPTIEPSKLRKAMRIDDTVKPPQLYHAATEAIGLVNQLLKDWRLRQQAAGVTRLDELMDDDAIDGKCLQSHRYLKAVYAFTKANTMEKYLDFDSTAQADTKAEAKAEQADRFKRDGHAAISDLLQKPRIQSDLV